eukprot:CAMPEP_0173423962 /NCGR_PEP_ID=MMETSP1357-20121228/4042_1 /TAXON_ID=77926 /ORGANISM="Hemiselmis rufescens, Strain PCC563" /LENGTH=61 /DNA_ID=CAMNT_0014387127 /DNA_START=22 /DNA_END=204 /DNA_ORIENTATION=+
MTLTAPTRPWILATETPRLKQVGIPKSTCPVSRNEGLRAAEALQRFKALRAFKALQAFKAL